MIEKQGNYATLKQSALPRWMSTFWSQSKVKDFLKEGGFFSLSTDYSLLVTRSPNCLSHQIKNPCLHIRIHLD